MNEGVVITGASGGIGQALCKAFSDAGYFVVATDERHAEVGDAFVMIDLVRFVRQPPDRERALAAIHAALDQRRLVALVNNAATQRLGSVGSVSPEDWQLTLDINVSAPMHLSQALLVDLEEARGSIVNIASIHAQLTKPGFVAYATSKAALEGLTRAMAVDLGGRVRVNAVSPAATRTPMLVAGFDGNASALGALAAHHPAGRLGEPSEVAAAALWLASPAAAFITGAVLGLDGGISARLHDPM